MDMSESKKEITWVFPDTQGLPMQGKFLSCENEISKAGANQFPVITLETPNGKLKLSKWRTDVMSCVIKYGKDSSQWVGKYCEVDVDSKGKLILKPCESDIQVSNG